MVPPAIWSALPHAYAITWILSRVAHTARGRLPLFKVCRRSHAPLADPAPAWYAWPQEAQHDCCGLSSLWAAQPAKEALLRRLRAGGVARPRHAWPILHGNRTPSPEDVAVTREIVAAGKLLDITVLDHLVIGHQRFVSLKEKGLSFGA